MPRVKRGFKTKRRHKKVLKRAKGFHASRGKVIRVASHAVDKALKHAYRGRKLKKRIFRGLWQTRIAAAAKAKGTSYSRLIGVLKKKNVELNRKMLAEIAVRYPDDFACVVEMTKS
jgi:large subunit ribosomal protein L20